VDKSDIPVSYSGGNPVNCRRFKYGLPFVDLFAGYNNTEILIPSVLVDTGSASMILSSDILAQIGVIPEPNDVLRNIRGIGGTEVVFCRQLQFLKLNQIHCTEITIEIGAMEYGFEINGILGMDFLLKTGCTINLRNLTINDLK
jgi:hypothetical protein